MTGLGDAGNLDDLVYLGLALKNYQSSNELRRFASRFENLVNFLGTSRDRSKETLSVDYFLTSLFPEVLSAMEAERGSIALKTPDPIEDSFYLVAQNGIEGQILHNLLSNQDAPRMHEAMQSSSHLVINDNISSLLMPFKFEDSSDFRNPASQNSGLISLSRKGSNPFENEKGDIFYLKALTQIIGSFIEEINVRKSGLLKSVSCLGMKDQYTEGHSFRVAGYAGMLAQYCGLNISQQEMINLSGQLHDLGKMGIPDEILQKKGRLDETEFDMMKTHTTKGAVLLIPRYKRFNGSSFPNASFAETIAQENSTDNATYLPGEQINRYMVVKAALQHHEKPNGGGYPSGYKNEQISLIAKIIAVADAFDAMSVKRCYRDALLENEIYKQIEKGKGTQFDPDIVDTFLSFLPRMRWLDLEQREYHTPFCETFAELPHQRLVLKDIYKLHYLDMAPCPDCNGKRANIIEVK